MAYKGMEDYVTVAERIVEFRRQYPDGRLRQKEVKFIEFAGKSWVVYTAEAWRTADDPAPAHGTAWEQVPGPTQFTRDSELQNAESSAWGRALVAALAVDTQKGVASREEIMARQGVPVVEPATPDEIAHWVSAFDAASTLDELQSHWEAAGKAGVTRDAEVIKAKDNRKAEL